MACRACHVRSSRSCAGHNNALGPLNSRMLFLRPHCVAFDSVLCALPLRAWVWVDGSAVAVRRPWSFERHKARRGAARRDLDSVLCASMRPSVQRNRRGLCTCFACFHRVPVVGLVLSLAASFARCCGDKRLCRNALLASTSWAGCAEVHELTFARQLRAYTHYLHGLMAHHTEAHAWVALTQ